MSITIYTDGSSRGNPGPGGWGAIILNNNDIAEIGGRENMTTNNRMELMACIESLKSLNFNKDFNKDNSKTFITLYSDSQYVIKGMTEWIEGWQRKNWKNSQKKDVSNRDLWELMLEFSNDKNIEWKYIKGHAENPGNNRCDEIATNFADNTSIELYKGTINQYKIKII